MLSELKKIGIFIKRDFKIIITYRLAFSAMFLNMIFFFFYFILFGAMFGETTPPLLNPYQQDFVTYLLIGSIGWGFLWSVMSSSSGALRNEMMIGTLESILLTSTRLSTLIIAYTIFGCFIGFLSILILITIGFLFFDIIIAINLITIIIFILSTFMMAGLGLLFSGLTLWIKNIGDTIPLIQNVAMFFSGVYFPITVLPEQLQDISYIIPFYYSIEGIRISLIDQNASLFYIQILIPVTILFIFLGVISLHFGLQKAKKEGSLAFY